MLINQLNIEILKIAFHNRKRYNIKEVGEDYIIIKSRRNHLFYIYLNKDISVYLMDDNNKILLRSFKKVLRARELFNYMYKLGAIL